VLEVKKRVFTSKREVTLKQLCAKTT